MVKGNRGFGNTKVPLRTLGLESSVNSGIA
jgi:hypothetical protein